ncbi:MAG: SDR family NAD(P)-dependent oxidoreductase [Patescibacteria group bacterium]|nr:SDR family NAD(P)-dependent oxidoreductase [Patescibacteria group bacterium]
MVKKIIITGSSGTIGTRLSQKLLEKGYEIIGVDWKKNRWDKDVENRTIHLDLRNRKLVLEKLPKNVDFLIHLAANARVYNLVLEPSLAFDNIMTTFNILEFARLNNVKKIIFASSREVYGNQEKIAYSEKDTSVDHIESPYSASKFSGESLIRAYQKCYGINFIVFRLSNVYGMYDDSDRIIPLFIKKAKINENLIIYGKNKILDFTYIDDSIEAFLLAIKNFFRASNQVFNISYGKGTRIIELAKLIIKNINSKSKILVKNNRKGEVVKYIGNINKAKKILGYNPKINVEEGIKKSIEWYLNL